MAPLDWDRLMKLNTDELEDPAAAEDMFEVLAEVG